MRTTPIVLLALCACWAPVEGRRAARSVPAASTGGPGPRPEFPERPIARASQAFGAAWHDGRAEMSSYEARVPRYGALRRAELVLVYVTEPADRSSWIKDDDAPADRSVEVMKLNASLAFQTGVYPYSVLTSVFSPVDAWRAERFSPVKISLSAQEWCGHVFHAVWPGRDRFLDHRLSYFADEGERTSVVETPPDALYEDALLIQLRELDGPFAGGGNWQGSIVPSLWRGRRTHQEARPVAATIARTESEVDGARTHRFALAAGEYRRTFDVEADAPHRVIAWTTSDGEHVRIRKSARLRYWELNHPGDEARREEFGLPSEPAPPIEAPAGTTIGP